MRKWKVSSIILMVLTVVLAGVLAWGLVNRVKIIDYIKGVAYQPSSEMVRIRDDLNLTDEGKFLFNAVQPQLSERESFNNVCRTTVDVEVAVLGCYTGGNVYVFNVEDKELDGIRELTTAHELLHAVWARMSEDEKVALVEPLTHVFEDNQGLLEDEITTYDINERQEELYVRAGTEVANLPDVLEKHYAEVFSDQDLIVSFYNKYIKVFKEIETEMNVLKAEMDEISTMVETKTAEYEMRANNLEAEVTIFNQCARTEGCFSNEGEFYTRRNMLIAEQDALSGLYDEINSLINEYNDRVEKYNNDVTRSEQLNRMINSSSRVDGVK